LPAPVAEASSLDVRALARASVGRLLDRLAAQTPALAGATSAWIRSLSDDEPADYFTHVEAFPMLSLPWWMEESFGGGVDEAFQFEVAYSSVSGYYFVRLLDDAMDGAAPPADVMPAAIVFHTEFFGTYRFLFPSDHDFWDALERFSYDSAETASADARLSAVELNDFERISSRKVSGAKIPLAAVALRYGRDDRLADWLAFVDVLGRWHQMRNDVLGWMTDRERGRATYFLSEGSRRARAGEPVSQWVVREGLSWAATELDRWMDELIDSARSIGSNPLIAYLEARRETSMEQHGQIAREVEALSALANALGGRR
jgi:hypothetical protein